MSLPPAVGVKLYWSVFPFGIYFLPKKSTIHINLVFIKIQHGVSGLFFSQVKFLINFFSRWSPSWPTTMGIKDGAWTRIGFFALKLLIALNTFLFDAVKT